MRRAVLVGALGLAALAAAAEAAVRAVAPAPPSPVVMDGVVGYRATPGRSGVNAYSMRSAAPPGEACTVRILVLGDSVAFGGISPAADLATTFLERELTRRLRWPVWVGNASADGWAAANLAGYVDKYGWFEADLVGFVLNSHDIDQPGKIEADIAEGPPRPSPSALVDLVDRTVVARATFELETWRKGGDPYAPAEGTPKAADIIATLFAQAKAHGPASVFHNRVAGEILAQGGSASAIVERARAPRLEAAAERAGVAYVDLGPRMAATPGAYADAIHLTSTGQRAMGEAMVEAFVDDARAAAEDRARRCG